MATCALASVSSIATAAQAVGKNPMEDVTCVAVRSPRTDPVPETGVTPRMPRAICTAFFLAMTRREDETQPLDQSPVPEEEVAEPKPVGEWRVAEG